MSELLGWFLCYANTVLLYQSEFPSENKREKRKREEEEQTREKEEQTTEDEDEDEDEDGKDRDEDGKDRDEDGKDRDGSTMVSNELLVIGELDPVVRCTYGLHGTDWYTTTVNECLLELSLLRDATEAQTKIVEGGNHALEMVKVLRDAVRLWKIFLRCFLSQTPMAVDELVRLSAIYRRQDVQMRRTGLGGGNNIGTQPIHIKACLAVYGTELKTQPALLLFVSIHQRCFVRFVL